MLGRYPAISVSDPGQNRVAERTPWRSAVDLIASGLFSHGDTELFRPLTENLIHSDPFMVLADFHDYRERQQDVDRAYRDPHHWDRMSILNTTRMGKFSSDRAINDYAERIWKAKKQR